MERMRQRWQKIKDSRLLAAVGLVAIVFVAGAGITRASSVSSTSYLIPASTLSMMQQQIQDLTNRVTSLETQMRVVQSATPPRPVVQPISGNPVVNANPTYTYTYQTSNPNYTYPPTPTNSYTYPAPAAPARPVVIDQNGGTYVAGFDIYITGRGFLPNEQVLVTRNGVVVGHTVVDAGGSFSTNGILLPLGPNTFVFTGQTSGISAVASVNGATSVI